MKFRSVLLLLLTLLVFFEITSCKKDRIISDGSKKLSYSVDTLTFDTVFTTLASTTKWLKIINPYNGDIEINHVYLELGSISKFRLNIDGEPTNALNNLIIPAHDSVYVFVEVTVDPVSGNLPYIYSDNLIVEYNGNQDKVNLMAWGQNAHFIYGEIITTNTTWDNDLPYVLVGKRLDAETYVPGVIVAAGATLTINPGVKIYCFNNGGIYSWGRLIMNGTKSDSIVIQGVRLEHLYDDLPGQWPGVFIFRNSLGNLMNYVYINESNTGLTVGSDTTNDLAYFTDASRPDLLITNSVIENSYGSGLFAFNAEITSNNCLIYNTAGNALTLGLGGRYEFNFASIYNGGSAAVSHEELNLVVSNFAQNASVYAIGNLDQAQFNNCIIYGSLEDELSLNRDEDLSGVYNLNFDHCLLRSTLNVDSLGFNAIILNENPGFEDAYEQNFHLTESSVCIDAGFNIPSVSSDFEGNARIIGSAPDLGVFEHP